VGHDPLEIEVRDEGGQEQDRHQAEARDRRDADVSVVAHGAFSRDLIKTYALPRGNAFFEDTFGVHKGTLPRSRRRLLFQARYSLFPIAHYSYEPVEYRDNASLPANVDPYVNRLHIRLT